MSDERAPLTYGNEAAGYSGQPGYPPQQGQYPPQPAGGQYPPQPYPPQPAEGQYPPQPAGGQYPPQPYSPEGGCQPQYPVQPQPGQGGMGAGAQQAQQFIQYIGNAQKLVIKERVNALEVASDMVGCCFNQENTYDVFDALNGMKVMEVKEESSLMCRMCCKPHHPLKLNMKDPNGNDVLVMDKPFKCAGPCPAWGDCCQQEGILYAGSEVDERLVIGKTKEPCCGGFMIPKLEVTSGVEERDVAVIEGPCCCFGGFTEFCFDQPFHVKTEDGAPLATITKEKPHDASQALKELISDADIYSLTFESQQLTAEHKTILLSSLLLLDYQFFETKAPFECNPFTQTCTCTCCHFYICGAFLPCKCSVGGGGEGGDDN